MMFEELVGMLKKVKKPEDVTPELADHLINAGIICMLASLQQSPPPADIPEPDAVTYLEVARNTVLRQFDHLMLAAYEDMENWDDDVE